MQCNFWIQFDRASPELRDLLIGLLHGTFFAVEVQLLKNPFALSFPPETALCVMMSEDLVAGQLCFTSLMDVLCEYQRKACLSCLTFAMEIQGLRGI